MYKYKLYYKVGFLQIDEVLVHCRRTGPHAGPALMPTSEQNRKEHQKEKKKEGYVVKYRNVRAGTN